MLLMPDPDTAVIDPFPSRPTLSLLCDVFDPITREPYERHPRQVAQRAEAFLKKSGIGDTCYVGPEPEFFLLDDVRYESGTNHSFYVVDSEEGAWNSGKDYEGGNLGIAPASKGATSPSRRWTPSRICVPRCP